MDCPACHVELRIADRQGIEIDYCPQCRGVWLDRGELDKIIERSVPLVAQRAPEAPLRDYPRDDERYEKRYERYGDEGYHKKRKRRSFLDDLFDFD